MSYLLHWHRTHFWQSPALKSACGRLGVVHRSTDRADVNCKKCKATVQYKGKK